MVLKIANVIAIVNFKKRLANSTKSLQSSSFVFQITVVILTQNASKCNRLKFFPKIHPTKEKTEFVQSIKEDVEWLTGEKKDEET